MDILRPGAEGGALLDEAALAAALSSSPPARTTIASALASALVSSGLPSPATLPDPTLAVRLLTAAVCDGALGGALAAALFGPAATGATLTADEAVWALDGAPIPASQQLLRLTIAR